jgi:hypothetical protein
VLNLIQCRNDGIIDPGVDSPVIPGLTRDLVLVPIVEIAGRARNDGFLVPGLDPGPHPGPHHGDCGAELDSVPH